MDEDEARAILLDGYGSDREDTLNLCFGNCCLRRGEKEALVTLIYGPAEDWSFQKPYIHEHERTGENDG